MADAKPSKSARKRLHLELQALGERLIALSDEQLAAIPVDDDLRVAVTEARRISSRGALRRQKQLIGKLMRVADADAIRAALELATRSDREDKAVFRQAEQWRDRIAGDSVTALEEFRRLIGHRSPRLDALAGELSAVDFESGRRRLRRQIFREVHRELTAMMQNGTG